MLSVVREERFFYLLQLILTDAVSGLLTAVYIPVPAYVMSVLLTSAYIRKSVCSCFRGGSVRRISAAPRPSPVKGTVSVAAIYSAHTRV